ncbi:MAG: ASKHA domain-containing protein [Lachnospiraceae bacterium]|nr:ASKHA domain-containing protein [Lachnospiraceae bacterium]
MCRIIFVREKKEIQVPEGTTVLEAEIRAGLAPDAPCGGHGICGKCLVRILSQKDGDRADAPGSLVRACRTEVRSDLWVDTCTDPEQEHVILTEGFTRPVPCQPDLMVHLVRLTKPEPGEKRSDWERLLLALQAAGGPEPSWVRPDPVLASSLYERRQEAAEWWVIHTKTQILDLRREPGKQYLAAFDIGTTTVAGYLLDAGDGSQTAVVSRMNPQAQYGADVIARANYALTNGTEPLSRCIRELIRQMLEQLAAEAGVRTEEIFQVSVAGNTCMHHLFLGISPASLVHAPYTPALRQSLVLSAAEYGLGIHPRGQLRVLPDIAGYVGADTCGCLLALRPDQRPEVTLLLDIGTNGEMVLGNRDRLIACSTAAGPAFEGARIECGMRGAAGAVDHVSFENGIWHYTTVGGQPAAGLCGSGLIDLVACLLRAGLIDESGTLASGQEDPRVFMLAPPGESAREAGVYLTQKDIREVQLAKAAIAAGISLLMEELGISEDEVACVWLAGAFGNYMDPASAAEIGMLPKSLAARVQPVGNAAGQGAKIALLNREEWEQADALAEQVGFLELATLPTFQDCFVDELGF